MRNRRVLMLCIVGLVLAGRAGAETGCDDAGGMCVNPLDCQCVCTQQLVENFIWDAACEPICVGGCAGCGRASCGSVSCDDGCDSVGCAAAGLTCRPGILSPKPRVRTRNRLVRKTVIDYLPAMVCHAQPTCISCQPTTSSCAGVTMHLDGYVDLYQTPSGPLAVQSKVQPVVMFLDTDPAEQPLAPIVEASAIPDRFPSLVDTQEADLLPISQPLAPIIAAGDYNSSPEYQDSESP